MDEGDDEKDRRRSPNYPSISLHRAIGKIKSIWEKDGVASGTADVWATHWDTSIKSSSFLQTIASLRKYELIVDAPGPTRKFKLSKGALDIVMLSEDDPRRTAAIKKAALTPKLFSDLWKKHATKTPSDQNLTHELVGELDFMPEAAADAIKQYKKNIEFAKLDESDKIVEEKDDRKPEVRRPDASIFDAIFNPPTRLQTIDPKKDDMQVELNQDSFTLAEGKVVLQWPSKLGRESFDDLKDWLELQLRKIGRNVSSSRSTNLESEKSPLQ